MNSLAIRAHRDAGQVDHPGPPSDQTRKAVLTQPLAILLGLTLLGAALRFGTLNVQSIWLDESATMILVRRGFSGMLSHLAASESSPPLYYMLVWLWTKIFGIGPLGFRSLSALVGTITIPVMYAAGRTFSSRAGLWAAALTAVNPAMFYYSQEARAYALLVLFAAGAFVFWQQALRQPSRRNLMLWAAMSSLAILTHYFAAFLFLPELLFLARRLGYRRILIPTGSVLIVGLALAPLALRERADGKSNWIEEASLPSRIAESVKQFAVGLYGPLEIVSAAVVIVLAVGAGVLMFTRGREQDRDRCGVIVFVAAISLLIPLLLAAAHIMDVYDGRNVIATWIPLAVLVAAGLATTCPGRIGPLLGVCLCTISLLAIAAVEVKPAYQRDNWRGVSEALSRPQAQRVIVGPELSEAPLSIYMPHIALASGRVLARELDFVALRTRQSGGSPRAPVVLTRPPAGFRLQSVKRTETYAVSRFIAPRALALQAGVLRRLSGEPHAEVILDQTGES